MESVAFHECANTNMGEDYNEELLLLLNTTKNCSYTLHMLSLFANPYI